MLQQIYDAIRKDASDEKIIVAFDPFVHTMVRQPDGSYVHREPSVIPRSHVATDILTIGKFAALNDDGAVWYSNDGVIIYTDDEVRTDSVELKFLASDPWNKLCTLFREKKALTQRDLVRDLVFTFRGCVSPEFVRSVRTIKWSSNSEGQATVDRGKASLGKQISSKIEGMVDLPEEVVVTVPMYKEGGFASVKQVTCHFEADPENQTFAFYPFPGELENAVRATESELYKFLTGEVLPKDYKVFKGSPEQ